MNKESIFLIFTALGLIALAGFDKYGLYIAIGVFWIISAFNKYLGVIALWSITIFMAGFALMRLISIYAGNEFTKIDLSLLVAELTLTSAGYWLIKNRESY
jgi:hypothetical protein